MPRKLDSPAKPVWWKNTYFWIAGILLVVGIVGLPFIGGDGMIRDAGQRRETGLWLYYFLGALIMLVNGFISHALTVKHYLELQKGS